VDRFFEAKLQGVEPDSEDQLTSDEIEGFKLFTGKAKCDNCHSGPLYSDLFFHNTGVPVANKDNPDFGRAEVLALIKQDEFSCLSKYSDAKPEECRELNFMSEDSKHFEGAFKTPSLRGVSARAPYMHAGQIESLEAVVEHYVLRPDPFATMPEMDGTLVLHGNHNESPMIELSEQEKSQLVAFLKAL
jgi:cytochrome c peroxidase